MPGYQLLATVSWPVLFFLRGRNFYFFQLSNVEFFTNDFLGSDLKEKTFLSLLLFPFYCISPSLPISTCFQKGINLLGTVILLLICRKFDNDSS